MGVAPIPTLTLILTLTGWESHLYQVGVLALLFVQLSKAVHDNTAR